MLVSLADKLYNARTLLLDFRIEGPAVFERFKLSREEMLWYYGELAEMYLRRRPGALAYELKPVVADLRLERPRVSHWATDQDSQRGQTEPGRTLGLVAFRHDRRTEVRERGVRVMAESLECWEVIHSPWSLIGTIVRTGGKGGKIICEPKDLEQLLSPPGNP